MDGVGVRRPKTILGRVSLTLARIPFTICPDWMPSVRWRSASLHIHHSPQRSVRRLSLLPLPLRRRYVLC